MNESIVTHGRKGSTILLVIIVVSVSSLLLASFMRFTSFERAANMRQILRAEARLAAESLANYAAADLVHQFESKPLHKLENYQPTILDVPDSLKSKLGQGRISVDSLQVSIVPDGLGLTPVYIDPNNPANQDDPLKGKIAHVRNFNIYAQAVAYTGSLSMQSHIEIGMQVRDAPFFSYGAFYAMDMEFMPETNTEIIGPIHSNENIFVSCSQNLKFHESVTAAGKILHGVKLLDGEKYSGSLGDVFFKNLSDDFIPMKRNESSDGTAFSDWIDHHFSNRSTWADDAALTWDGLVQDEAHEIPKINLAGFESYAQGTHFFGDDSMNHSYAIIEPVLATDQANVREQKLSMKSSLIFRISGDARQGAPYSYSSGVPDVDFTENTYEIRAFRYQMDANGKPEIDDTTNKPIEIEVKLPAGLIGDANGTMDAIDTDARVEGFRNVVNRTTYIDVEYPVYVTETVQVEVRIQDQLDDLFASFHSQLNNLGGGADNVADTIDSITTWYNTSVAEVMARDPDENGAYYINQTNYLEDDAGNRVQATNGDGNLVFETKQERQYSYGYNESGFAEIRQHTGSSRNTDSFRKMDAVYMNIERLRELIHEDTDAWNVDYADRDELDVFKPNRDWNGIVYLELPYAASTREDNIVVAKDKNLGVMLINGDQLPTNVADSKEEGFTFATNGPVYVVGNYNADGDLATGSATEYEQGEVPALIAADSITVLSAEFPDVEPLPTDPEILDTTWRPTGRRQQHFWVCHDYGNGANKASTPVEMSAALIAGITPTVSFANGGGINYQSGGVHNFIRFMQDWSPNNGNPTDFVYRGSMVALFESMVHNSKIGDNYSCMYEPPERRLVFNKLFREGRFPPGTPKGRTYRKTSLSYPTSNEYSAVMSAIN